MAESDGARLDRLINRIDDALIRLTTLEERLAQNGRTLERVFKSMDDCEQRIQKLETNQAVSQTKIGFSERIIWMFISVIVGIVAYSFKGM
jgi:uncharacterized coiled-coil protein SlyX